MRTPGWPRTLLRLGHTAGRNGHEGEVRPVPDERPDHAATPITLSVENTFNNCCVALVDRSLNATFNRQATFEPSPDVKQDSADWTSGLAKFHMRTLPTLLKDARLALGQLSAVPAFISLSIVRGRENPNVEIARGIVREFASGQGYEVLEVDHLDAHVMSVRFCDPRPSFPFICALVSGGNSNLYLVQSLNEICLLGSHERAARNRYGHGRAIGAVLDRCAVLLGIVRDDQPDGAVKIDQLAARGDFDSRSLRRFSELVSDNASNGYDLDFHRAYEIAEEILATETRLDEAAFREHLAVSMLDATMRILVAKAVKAASTHAVRAICFVGGVAASSWLRHVAQQEAEKTGMQIFFAPRSVCGDNAVMIGALGLLQKGLVTM